MSEAYMLIGGNVGDTRKRLQEAIILMEKYCGMIKQQSSVYQTAPWGKTDQQFFLNQALIIQTTLEPIELMQEVLEIEEMMGRVREEKYGPRIIDIDILFFEQTVLDHKRLTLPHPEIQNRRFALVPLAEIAPDFIHPVFQLSVGELLLNCPDKLEVVISE